MDELNLLQELWLLPGSVRHECLGTRQEAVLLGRNAVLLALFDGALGNEGLALLGNNASFLALLGFQGKLFDCSPLERMNAFPIFSEMDKPVNEVLLALGNNASFDFLWSDSFCDMEKRNLFPELCVVDKPVLPILPARDNSANCNAILAVLVHLAAIAWVGHF